MMGGGGEQWGETVDTSDLEQTLWPRWGSRLLPPHVCSSQRFRESECKSWYETTHALVECYKRVSFPTAVLSTAPLAPAVAVACSQWATPAQSLLTAPRHVIYYVMHGRHVMKIVQGRCHRGAPLEPAGLRRLRHGPGTRLVHAQLAAGQPEGHVTVRVR